VPATSGSATIATPAATPGRTAGDAFAIAAPFFAAQGLPTLTLAMARSEWEADFLASVAAMVTPGAPHAWKRDARDSRRLSEKQRTTLLDIARRGSSGAASGGGGHAGAR